jgi:carbamoyltransferase
MIIWGINALNHDASLSVFHDEICVFASHSERFSGIKNDYFLNKNLIDYALQYGMPNEIVWSEKYWLKKLRQLKTFDFRFFDTSPKNHLKQFGLKNIPITYINHHECHSSAAAYTSNFNECLVFVFDGIGEFETITVWKKQNLDLKLLYSEKYPNSLGLFYSAFTKLLGLKPNEEEFILMGMAGYGKPKYKQALLKKFFEINYPYIKLKKNLHTGINFSYENKFDLAASVQAVYEEITENFCMYFRDYYNIHDACFSGGCALNCMANSKYLKIFQNVWIFPNAGDAGNSYGACLAAIKQNHFYDPYIGYDIKNEIDIDLVIRNLLKGKVIGLANGKAEFGPRALGNRSLLADPRLENIKDLMNEVKHREKFRPFAPSVLEESFEKIFKTDVQQSKFMNFIFENKYPNLFSGITHVDGTSRVQTIDKNSNTILKDILNEWNNKTNVPLLLNTSLNIKGQPLVNDENDVLKFKLKHNIDIF